jgi:hypothetical protein
MDMDDNAERLGRIKMRTDAMKRHFAINSKSHIAKRSYVRFLRAALSDFAKSQNVVAACRYCFGENDEPPKAAVIAMGTRLYLSCTLSEEFVDGHCHIAPIQHHLCMLEADDDVWDEVRVCIPSFGSCECMDEVCLTFQLQNFMKCFIRMAADAGEGAIFYETVINFKKRWHTYIECIPNVFDELPAYFRVFNPPPFIYHTQLLSECLI